MQKTQLNVRLDDSVVKILNATADRYGMTANTIVAAAAYELSRVRTENLWHALGRIAEGEGMALMPADTPALPAARRQPRKALPVAVQV